jgi:hypothetical protein
MSYVLIIEGDGNRTRRLSDICLDMGLETRVSADPLNALIEAINETPALILLEASDETPGAFSAAESLCRDRRLSAVPLLVVAEDSTDRSLLQRFRSRGLCRVLRNSRATNFERDLRHALGRRTSAVRPRAGHNGHNGSHPPAPRAPLAPAL